MQTIDMTPTWAGLLPTMLAILEDKSAPEAAKKPLREELMRLARAVDKQNERNKEARDDS